MAPGRDKAPDRRIPLAAALSLSSPHCCISDRRSRRGANPVSKRAAHVVSAAFLAALVAGQPAIAAPRPPAAARFMSLRTDEANGRRGPSAEQPVLWVYKARGLPVEVLAGSGDYAQIRDPDGDKAWVHRSQLSARRTVWVLPIALCNCGARRKRPGGRWRSSSRVCSRRWKAATARGARSRPAPIRAGRRRTPCSAAQAAKAWRPKRNGGHGFAERRRAC